MQVKFWGTRGSYPRFGQSDNLTLRSEHTPCVEFISADQSHLVVDAGTGFEGFAREHFKKFGAQPIHLLLTHFHWDHILGLLMIYDLYFRGLKIHVSSPFGDARETLLKLFQEPFCPISEAVIGDAFSFSTLSERETRLADWRISPIKIPHLGLTYGYFIRDSVSAALHTSDFAIDQADANLFKSFSSADLLICDSFHLDHDKTKLGSLGHSSVSEALQIAQDLSAKKLALFHYSPAYGDAQLNEMLAVAAAKKNGAFLAIDGLTVTV